MASTLYTAMAKEIWRSATVRHLLRSSSTPCWRYSYGLWDQSGPNVLRNPSWCHRSSGCATNIRGLFHLLSRCTCAWLVTLLPLAAVFKKKQARSTEESLKLDVLSKWFSRKMLYPRSFPETSLPFRLVPHIPRRVFWADISREIRAAHSADCWLLRERNTFIFTYKQL